MQTYESPTLIIFLLILTNIIVATFYVLRLAMWSVDRRFLPRA